jgi:hypothetical protein
MNEKLHYQDEDITKRYEKQLAMLRQEVTEKVKRLDVINFEHQEELRIQVEGRDKEIRLVQD